ncbi:MAG: DUF4249 family protein [Bacteroidota bacterium]
MKTATHITRLLFFITACALLLTCIDQLELKPSANIERGVAIQGELIKGEPSVLKVQVRQLFNFANESRAPIRVNAVYLIDEKGTEMLISDRSTISYNYTFQESDPIQIEFGQSYKIRVELQNGKRIESDFEALIPLPQTNSALSFRLDTITLQQEQTRDIVDEEFVQFLINTSVDVPEGITKPKLLWQAERTYQFTDFLELNNFESKTCYATVGLDFDELKLLDTDLLTTDQLIDFPLSQVLLNFEFAEGYYYTVYQKSLTEGAFNYYSRIKELIERDGQIFDPAVGLIPSNLSNTDDPKDTEIYGYFTAYTQDTLRICVRPEEVGNPVRICPPNNPRCPQPCCDCLVLQGSQLSVPDFWEK